MSCAVPPQFIITSIIFAVCAISVIWFIFQYCKDRQKIKIEATQCLYRSVSVFFLLIAASLIAFAIQNAFGSCNPAISNTFVMISRVTFILQLVLLLWLLFYRLISIFKNSMFAISKRVQTTFYVTYISFIVVAIFTVIVVSSSLSETILRPIVIVVSFLFAVAYIIALVWILIHKLLIVTKHVAINGEDSSLLITKIFILSLTSIFCMILVAISSIVGGVAHMKDDDKRLFQGLFMAIHLCGNFYSLFLGFGHFTSYYMCICGVCQKQCNICCLNVVGNDLKKPSIPPVKVRTGSTSTIASTSTQNMDTIV